MSINTLPPELLAQILNDENSSLILSLWKTGDRILQSKLKNHGIAHMDLRHMEVKSQFWNSKWPRCLKEFRLRSLTVSLPSYAPQQLHIIRSELMRQHPMLESLSLHFKGAIELFSADSENSPVVPTHQRLSSTRLIPLSKRPKVNT